METAISGVKWGGNGVEMEMEMASHFPVSEMEMETAVEMGWKRRLSTLFSLDRLRDEWSTHSTETDLIIQATREMYHPSLTLERTNTEEGETAFLDMLITPQPQGSLSLSLCTTRRMTTHSRSSDILTENRAFLQKLD